MSSNAAELELNRKIKELDELLRVVSNGINWISDLEVKVAYIQPVSEFVSFLQGFKGNIEQQRVALKAVTADSEVKVPEVVA